MACRTPKLPELVLSDDEVSALLGWTRRRKTAQALALRAQIVLRCAEGGSNSEIAAELGAQRATVAKWRSRFVADRLDGLLDEARPGRPRTISDEQVEAVITATLESTPANATHWSTRSMAAESRVDADRGDTDLERVRSSAASP
ncbi:Winged helix-turn helix [Lentzea fradiae]|uniref:Winged helix-turn helix n=1 Tax=Lentzea fradiae TaxID=200378 RepID=A0A1G7P5V7_9PSEU|nr:Winged helix-turn helix [Lentzea fradiae]